MSEPKVNMASVHEAYANATMRYLQALAARREYEEATEFYNDEQREAGSALIRALFSNRGLCTP